MSTKYATERQRSRTANRVTSDPSRLAQKGRHQTPSSSQEGADTRCYSFQRSAVKVLGITRVESVPKQVKA